MSWAKGWMTKLGAIITMGGGLAKVLFPGKDEAIDLVAQGAEQVTSGGLDIWTGVGLFGVGVGLAGARRAIGRVEARVNGG